MQVGSVRRGRRPAGYASEFVMKDVMTEPIFPIRCWNVFKRVEASRTNNFTESCTAHFVKCAVPRYIIKISLMSFFIR